MRLLVAEDETAIAHQVATALREAGFVVDIVGNGIDAWHSGTEEPYDAVILDIGLPALDGLSVIRRWRNAGNNVPVLLLTARGAWSERVEGIDAGADDYLPKPFHLAELVARMRGLIRRSKGFANPVIQYGKLWLDTRTMEVSQDGTPLPLTAVELRLLSYLLHNRDKVSSRTQIAEHLYQLDQDRDSNTIEVFIARLRRKLGPDSIRTVRGVGYRLGDGG